MVQNILVVDDNQLVLYGLAKALQSDALAVETAATANKALKKLSFCAYDLCLLDINLPDLNGLELMKMIRDVYPNTKIIVMTASNLDSPEISENINAAIANGACHFIAKPFNLNDVTEVVQEVLTGKDDFHTGFRFTDSGFVKKTRKQPRKPYKEKISFQMSVIDQGNFTRWSLEAQAVDISDGGIGLLSQHFIKESQVIGFDEKMGNRTGVVVWSQMSDEDNCRVGIRFA
jgi:CheY-like chemotaxis protein